MGFVMLLFLVFCVVLLYFFTFLIPCCDVRYDFRIKRCSSFLYLQLCIQGLVSYLRYLCLLAHSGVQHILGCVFCLVCPQLVYPMLPVSLDCSFFIVPSVVSNVNSMCYLCYLSIFSTWEGGGGGGGGEGYG